MLTLSSRTVHEVMPCRPPQMQLRLRPSGTLPEVADPSSLAPPGIPSGGQGSQVRRAEGTWWTVGGSGGREGTGAGPSSLHPPTANPPVFHEARWRYVPAFCEPRPCACTMCLLVLSIRLMSDVLYARVPSETKGAIDAFAGANGRSVAAAVAELLSRGLQATSQSSQIAELQERLQRTELALARKDVELHEAKLALESFVQREGDRLPRRPGELPTSVRTAQEGS